MRVRNGNREGDRGLHACRDRYAQDLFGSGTRRSNRQRSGGVAWKRIESVLPADDGQQAINYDLCMKPRAGARMRTVSRDGRDEDPVGACTCHIDAGTE